MSQRNRPTVAAAPGDAAGPPLPDAAKTILICEDEASLRELIRAVLGPEYRYAEAVDGSEGLELVRSLAPDLVLLDLMMPLKNGFQVLEAMRSDAATSSIPVVVLTAWSHAAAAAAAAGADRFLQKPFEPQELQDAVRELLAAS